MRLLSNAAVGTVEATGQLVYVIELLCSAKVIWWGLQFCLHGLPLKSFDVVH
jgi:hypothetical protein